MISLQMRQTVNASVRASETGSSQQAQLDRRNAPQVQARVINLVTYPLPSTRIYRKSRQTTTAMVLAAVGQLCSRNNVQLNLRICRSVVSRAAKAGAKFICLPEASDFIVAPEEVYSLSQPLSDSFFLKGIQEAAKAGKIWVSFGMHEKPAANTSDNATSSTPDKRCYNTQCLVSPEGQLASIYRKLHLFDVDFKGSLSSSESKTTIKGTVLPEVTETAVGKVGMLTCYDMRFPEVALILRQRGAEIITYPSAFAVRTGMVHWTPILQTRAIETQTFVLAAAQVGTHAPTSRTSFGRACIIDPWGTVLAQCNDNLSQYQSEDEDSGTFCLAESVSNFDVSRSLTKLKVCFFVSLDLQFLENIRKEMPLWHQRRPDVYGKLEP